MWSNDTKCKYMFMFLLNNSSCKELRSQQHHPWPMSELAPLLHPCLGEKLPWTVEISGASVYTIHQSSQLHYLAEPASVSATVAVTTKYTPPMSDNITSLGLVLHADLDTMVVACSQRQVGMWIFVYWIVFLKNGLFSSTPSKLSWISLTDCGLVTLPGDVELGEQWLR